jgi:hypothetical protein
MRRAFLGASCLALALLGALVVGTSLGRAEVSPPVERARPTATPDGLGPFAAPLAPNGPALPDLIVAKIETVPEEPLINEEVLIRVTIENQGTADVSLGPPPNNFYTDLYIDPAMVPINLGQDGVMAWPCQAWWVPAGGSWTLETTFVFTDVRMYTVYAQVDTDGDVAELNENNNVHGPVYVKVGSPNELVHETHQDFQMGLASSLDVTHPDGVLRRGIFDEPYTEPEVYTPDVMINDVTGTFTVELSRTSVNQVNPALTGDGHGTLFAVWEDGRNGYFKRDIFFARSVDSGATWSPDLQVNDVITGIQSRPDLAYDASRARLYAVWQDGRIGFNADDDVYFAYSDDQGSTWSASQRLNDAKSTSHQMNPSIAVGPSWYGGDPRVYVAWQDRRNGNDDVYLARSDDGGLTWGPITPTNYFVTDDPQMTQQDQRAPSVGVDGEGVVFVCWEDWRWGTQHPEVYCVNSFDEGETFGIDVPVSLPPGESYRVEPTMVVTTTGVQTVVTTLHVAWQQGKGEEADVYWAYANYNFADPEFCYPYDFCFNQPVEVSGLVIDLDFALPPDNPPPWPIEPSWQGQVSLALAPPSDLTYCHAGSTITYSSGVYVAWSDSRTYDDWRYEIRTRRAAGPGAEPTSFEPCEDWAGGVVNDDAKLYFYRNDLDLYQIFEPAATRQSNPSVYRDGAGLYVAWDDDRWDRPLEPGTVRNRDVFFARAGIEPEGIYISPVIDAQTVATWYALSWWGTTDHYADLLLQTRLGDDPYPPREDISTTHWTLWSGNPSSPYLGCDAGAGCYYDAPGRHIVGPDGVDWPERRYIQYKVIIQDDSWRTTLSQVTIYYKGLYMTYLPIIGKRSQGS